jgi:hypothetical protein
VVVSFIGGGNWSTRRKPLNACILFLCNGLTTAVINIYYWFLQNESKLEKNPNRSEISLVSE